MSRLRFIFRLARADFQERSRRISFLLTLGFVLYAAFLFLPPNHAQYATLQMGGHRGVYNSAWVGTLVAMHTAMFLSLAGFYLVKNALDRDRQTRVGEVLAATPLSNGAYMLAKMLSNFMVLSSMVAVMVVAALAMQWIRQEETVLRPLVLVAPFLFLTLPFMALIAAVAVLFESIPRLRGGLGNIIYYFLWTAMIISSAVRAGGVTTGLDPVGLEIAIPQMTASCERAFPDYDAQEDSFSMGFNFRPSGQPWELKTFAWDGVAWTWGILFGRLIWIGLALATVFAALLAFDRFDPARANPPPSARARKAKRDPSPIASTEAALSTARPPLPTETLAYNLAMPSAQVSAGWAGQTLRLVISELRLALLGVSRWWYAVAASISVVCIFAPMELVRAFFFPLAWIWPILLWSSLGTREMRYGTDALLYSSPRPLLRQLPAMWLAGVLIAAATGSGMLVRLLVEGDLASSWAWFAGALFVPSFALFLGTTSGHSKLFEILYLIIWYAGPVNKAVYLDFMGTSPESLAAGVPYMFAAVSVACLAGAFVARGLRLRK